MSVTLNFTDKHGKPGSLTFPSRQVAEVYARGVKNPTFSDSDVACDVAVVKCGTPEQEDRKRKEATLAALAEREAEAYMEAGVETALQGGSGSEILDNAAEAESNVRKTTFHSRGIALAKAKKEQVEKVCACGKIIRDQFHSTCYTCRRYR